MAVNVAPRDGSGYLCYLAGGYRMRVFIPAIALLILLTGCDTSRNNGSTYPEVHLKVPL